MHVYTYMILPHPCGQGSHQSVKDVISIWEIIVSKAHGHWVSKHAHMHAYTHARTPAHTHTRTWCFSILAAKACISLWRMRLQQLRSNNLKGAWALGFQARTHACVHACTHTNAHEYMYMMFLHPCGQGLHQSVTMSHQHLRSNNLKGAWASCSRARTHACVHACAHTNAHAYAYMIPPHPCGQSLHQSVKASHQNLKSNNFMGALALGPQAHTHLQAYTHARTTTHTYARTWLLSILAAKARINLWTWVITIWEEIISKAHGHWVPKHAHMHAYTHASS